MDPEQELELIVDTAVLSAAESIPPTPEARARVLDAVATALDERKEEVRRTAAEETALTEGELDPEFARMTGTFRMFAAVIREGSWVRAVIDPRAADPARAIGPNHDVRRMLVPLPGVVAVFGASNFPLAYGVCGGDTASALAAGCAVVVKEHPAHPRTGRLIAGIARKAIASTGASEHLLGYLENEDPDDLRPATELVKHPAVVAVGFTGSHNGGMALDRLARERAVPIPVFAEMGSSNIVLITRAAAAECGPQIAEELKSSILARFGQQCTNTGVLLLDDPAPSRTQRTPDPIFSALRAALTSAPPREMLSERVRQSYTDRLEDIGAGHPIEAVVHAAPPAPIDAPTPGRTAAPALVVADHSELNFDDPRYRDEIFGPACITATIDLDDENRLREILSGMNGDAPWGQLVACLYIGSSESPQAAAAIRMLSVVAGRVVVNGPPTGVRVAHAMVHGGPWPATNRPDTTAVGPYAIERWCRPVCFQNCPDGLLPPGLQDANPLGILRVVSGVPTRDPVTRPS